MVKRQSDAAGTKSSQTDQRDKRKPKGKGMEHPSEPVDRPGADLGGSTGKTSAGTGLGLGQDASERRSGRSLPGRRAKSR